jgi:hypothetical protein
MAPGLGLAGAHFSADESKPGFTWRALILVAVSASTGSMGVLAKYFSQHITNLPKGDSFFHRGQNGRHEIAGPFSHRLKFHQGRSHCRGIPFGAKLLQAADLCLSDRGIYSQQAAREGFFS